MKTFVLSLLLLFYSIHTFSQNKDAGDYIEWSSTDRLSVTDFKYRKSDSIHNFCNATFIMEYNRPSFSFKAYNKRFHNLILKSTSWIDTSLNISFQITYLQALFDIQEIYTRQWRRAFSEKFNDSPKNLRKTQNKAIANAINRQENYQSEILKAKKEEIQIVQTKWEETIINELNNLSDFAYEKRGF